MEVKLYGFIVQSDLDAARAFENESVREALLDVFADAARAQEDLDNDDELYGPVVRARVTIETEE